MHDAQLGDTTYTDQDEAEKRDVVHHELCQFRSDVSGTSVDETLNVRSVVLARVQVYSRFGPFLPLPRDLARSVEAEPSCQKHQYQQQGNSLWHS